MHWKLKSHPNKLLRDHLRNAYEMGHEKLKSNGVNLLSRKNIELINKVILLTHDFGKATPFFQKKLELGVKNPNSYDYKKLMNDKRTHHGQLSALFTYCILCSLTGDFLSSAMGYIAVSRHHGNLLDFRDNLVITKDNWSVLNEQIKSIDFCELENILLLHDIDVNLREILGKDIKKTHFNRQFRRALRKIETTEEDFFMMNMLFSILVSADKGEVIFAKNNLNSEQTKSILSYHCDLDSSLIDDYRKIKKWDEVNEGFNGLRNIVYKEIVTSMQQIDLDRRIMSINVPTGIGKTVASIAAILKLRERLKKYNGKDYRLIYVLPFTSVIDQNYDVIREILEERFKNIESQMLLRHHYLTAKTFEEENSNNDLQMVSEHIIECWEGDIIVSTFIQLLESILTNQNRSLKKFNNMAKSIIVLDEVQFIPYKYWELIKNVLRKMSELFDCYFIFVTATMPLIFSEKKNEIIELATNKENYFKQCDRIELDLSKYRNTMKLEEFKSFIETELDRHYPVDSFLIVLNTINTSLEVYEYIKDSLKYDNVVYLSKNIVPKHIKERISEIKDSKTPLIVVSTQLVEAGVDIDFNRVYRDFAPLDSINQTSGRCNRNYDEDKKGIVTIVRLVNENHNNKKYAEYIYDSFLLISTKAMLDKLPNIVKEKEFFQMNKGYFEIVNEGKSESTSELLLDRIKKLYYSSAFQPAKGRETFKLIDNSFNTCNFFIEIDEKAEQVWQSYLELLKIEDIWEQKKAFEEIKESFLNYVITVSKDIASKQFTEEQMLKTFNHISKEEMGTVYDEKTGFIRDSDKDYFI